VRRWKLSEPPPGNDRLQWQGKGSMMSNAEKRIPLKEPADRGAGAGEADSGKTLTVTNDLLESQPDNRLSQDWKDRVGLATVAACLIIAAVAWYLLKEFAPLL